MNSPFSNSKYITTNNRLRKILRNCALCNKLTLNGSLIIPCSKLPGVRLPQIKQKKYFLIINIPNQSSDNNYLGHNYLGHWLGCCVNVQTRQCLLVDSANLIASQTGPMNYILSFCTSNHLTLVNFNLMFQEKDNVLCGQNQLYICSVFSKRSLRQTYNLRYMLQKYTLQQIAFYIIKQVEHHFHVQF